MQLCADLGRVVDALGDAGKEGLLLGVGALAGNAGGDSVAVDEGSVLVDREDNVGGDCWSWSGGHGLYFIFAVVGCYVFCVDAVAVERLGMRLVLLAC